MADRMQQLVEETASLISPPDVWIRLNEVVNDPSSSAEDIAEVVMHDPALTARVLQIVNSPLYPFKSHIDTVTMAISIMGTRELFSLATAVTTVNVFSGLGKTLLGIDTFWKHSLATAIMARRLARESCVLHPERLYVAGLLHDVGSLVMFRAYPDESNKAILAAQGDESALIRHERESVGFDHAALGAELMKSWRLPEALVSAIHWNQDPVAAGNNVFDASVIHLANAAATQQHFGLLAETADSTRVAINPATYEVTGLSETTLELLAEGLVDDLSVALSLFMPDMEISVSS